MPDYHLIGPYVRRFLIEELVTDRNLSLNTQKSYRDTIRLLFSFIADQFATDPTCVTIEQIDAALVRSFLAHLEQDRGNTISTRNQRLAALHSLFRFIGRLLPELVDHAAQIQAVPLRRTTIPVMPYLDRQEMNALLAVPDRSRAQGRRDYTLLLFIYNTGARASEVAQVTIADFNLGTSQSVRLRGKGRKIRICPLWTQTTETLRDLIGGRLEGPHEQPAFLNVRRQPMTRYGVHALVVRTAAKASAITPSLRNKCVTPHTIRHTTAVHLLNAGVDINTIRAWLGHASLETTNRYAEISLENKAKALQTCSDSIQPSVKHSPSWHDNSQLMAFLDSL